MKVYLVGGAVRDELLGLPVTERDYVVVGSSPEEMLQAGFRSVGKDFPVFLHPETKAEYALARTERKIGPGHQGFECHASPAVTLEEDLLRRDLSINAIAKDDDGSLIDPYDGQSDLRNKWLRHVSPAFAEDPLRILRLARFKARFHGLGFRVHADTSRLVRRMLAEEQLSQLPAERILAEIDRALATPDPAIFFEWLQEMVEAIEGAIEIARPLWPEITTRGIKRLAAHAQEITDIEGRFALLLADQDGGVIKDFCARLKCTRERTEMSALLIDNIREWAMGSGLGPADIVDFLYQVEEIVDFLYQVDALRRSERFARFNAMATDIAYAALDHPEHLKTRQEREDTRDFWIEQLKIINTVTAATMPAGTTGPALGEAIKQAQIARVTRKLHVGYGNS